MALSRIGNCQPNFWGNFNRHATIKSTSPFGDINHINETRMKGFHITRIRQYPETPSLRLPPNVSEIFSNETGRFTQERIRDIYSSSDVKQFSIESKEIKLDLHVATYDCFGTVSLNSSMQTNVPKPFNSNGKSSYLNMPGGQWARDGKYIAEDMQKSHSKCQLLKQYKNGFVRIPVSLTLHSRNYTTNASETKTSSTENSSFKLTKKEKFKIMVKDYGKTIIVFHIGISLLSLGGCYIAISSGVDMSKIVSIMSSNNNELINKIMTGSSTFAIAYGIHKICAPLRLMTTMTFAPVLVRYLRRKGILKHPEIAKKLKEAKLKASNPG